MATTRYVDIIEPTLFTQYMRESTPEKYVLLMQSGLLQAAPEEVRSQFMAGGFTIDMPFWRDLTRGEGNIPDDDNTSKLTLDKITADDERARRHFITQGWSSMDMSGYAATGSPEDPVKAIADGIQNWWYYLIENRVISTLNGIVADNMTNDSGDMVVDLYSDVVSPASNNRVSYNAITEAQMTLGDQFTKLNTLIMHSAIYSDLVQQDKIDFEKQSDGKIRIPYFQEKLVLVSDLMPVFAGTNSAKYRCYLVGPGAFSFIDDVPSEVTPKGTRGVEKDRDVLAGTGGGEDMLVTRRNFLIHPRGFDYAGTQAKKAGATLAELATAANWDRKYQRKNVPIAVLDVNA